MADNPTMKTLTIDGVTYEIYDEVARKGNITQAQIDALDSMFKIAAYTEDAKDAYAAFKSAFGIEDSGEDTHTHNYTSAVTTAATCTTAGVRTYTCSCGNSYTEAIPATGHNYVDGVCTVCGATDPTYNPEVTLSSISATYSGDDVAVGTAVSELTGIVVTAHYSDGTSESVTGYTLSGTIAEGENTITVSYGGMTTTFTVTGTAESGGEETINILDGVTWTAGNLARHGSTGEIVNNGTTKYHTGFIPLNGATKLVCHASGVLRQVGYFFTEESADSVVGAIALETVVSFYVSATNASYPSPVETAVPSGANYVIVQAQPGAVDNNELIIELA